MRGPSLYFDKCAVPVYVNLTPVRTSARTSTSSRATSKRTTALARTLVLLWRAVSVLLPDTSSGARESYKERHILTASIYPIDVVKSKLQTDSLDPAKRKYKGMLDCFAQTWRKQGVKGFTGGLTPTLIRSPFANGATFVAFELAMRAMGSDAAHSIPPDGEFA